MEKKTKILIAAATIIIAIILILILSNRIYCNYLSNQRQAISLDQYKPRFSYDTKEEKD